LTDVRKSAFEQLNFQKSAQIVMDSSSC